MRVGYGSVGYQQKFGTNSISASAKFAESGEDEVIIRLPQILLLKKLV